jgi:hypothetical protein
MQMRIVRQSDIDSQCMTDLIPVDAVHIVSRHISC